MFSIHFLTCALAFNVPVDFVELISYDGGINMDEFGLMDGWIMWMDGYGYLDR
jgi:hypothetical protein